MGVKLALCQGFRNTHSCLNTNSLQLQRCTSNIKKDKNLLYTCYFQSNCIIKEEYSTCLYAVCCALVSKMGHW